MGAPGRIQGPKAQETCFSLSDNFGGSQAAEHAGAGQAERHRRAPAPPPESRVELWSTPDAVGLAPMASTAHWDGPAARPPPAAWSRPVAPGPASQAWPSLAAHGPTAVHVGPPPPPADRATRWPQAAPAAAPHLAPTAPAPQARADAVVKRFYRLAQVLRERQCQPGQPLHQALLRHYEGNLRDTGDELELTLSALERLYALKGAIGPQEGLLAALMPQNMPLYSMVLYVIMPAILMREVVVHLPEAQRHIFEPIYQAVGRACAEAFPAEAQGSGGPPQACRIRLPEVGPIRWDIDDLQGRPGSGCLHQKFMDRWKDDADIVIVTGSFDAAYQIAAACPSSTLVIYNSSGINPAVVAANPPHPDLPGENRPIRENLQAIARRLVKARMLHNGQDCGAPDAIFVHHSHHRALVEAIKDCLRERGDIGELRSVRNSRKFLQAAKFVLDTHGLDNGYSGVLEHGGHILADSCKMGPAIVSHELSEYRRAKNKLKICEFYAPVFNIFSYADEDDLSLYFGHPDYVHNRMFLSLFGSLKMASCLELNHTLLRDQTVIDFDDVTVEYGGPGMRASGFIRDHQIYPKAINPMATISEHQRSLRSKVPGHSAQERTQLAHAAFDDVTCSLPEGPRQSLQWCYFWQDGKKKSVVPSSLGPKPSGKKTRASRRADEENLAGSGGSGGSGGGPAAEGQRPGPFLRSDGPLGVFFVVEGDDNKQLLTEAVQMFLRKKRAQHKLAHRGGACVASFLAQAAGMPIHLSDRTYIVTTCEAEEALAMVERAQMSLGAPGACVEVSELHKLLVVEAMAATACMGSRARPSTRLQQTLSKRARACAPLLEKMIEAVCAKRGEALLAGTAKLARMSPPDISYAHCQSLLMQPGALPRDGHITPPGGSPVSCRTPKLWRQAGG